MSVQWRINVWAPSGDAKPTIGMDDAIVGLDNFSVDGSGNCLEAEFRGVPADLWLGGRDVIQLEIDDGDGQGFVAVWKGFLIQVGPSRSRDIHTYRAMGMKHRFYERHVEVWFTPGAAPDDVADAVVGLFQTNLGAEPQRWTWPRGITASVQDIPQLGFQIGARYPNLETVGDTLDALAEAVGAFHAPFGSSYTYNGATYNGVDVPATRWGVDANGAFFFKRPQGPPFNFDEQAENILINWHDINAEEVCDHVTFVFASEAKEGWTPAPRNASGEPQPLWKKYGEVDAQGRPTGDLDVERRIVLDAPIDYMRRLGDTIEPVGSVWFNIENVADEDDSTFAELDNADGSIRIIGGSRRGSAIFRLRIRVDAPREIAISVHTSAQLNYIGSYRVEADSTVETYDLFLPILTNDHALDESGFHITVSGLGIGDQVYAMGIYEPDDDACDQLAEAYMRGLREHPSEVELVGAAGQVGWTARVRPIGESEINGLEVERIQYSLTAEDGLITRYFLQQPDMTDRVSERAVLERLSRSRGRDEASSLMKIKGAAKGKR